MTLIVIRPYNLKGLVWLLLLSIVTFFIRTESGILSLLFPFVYIYFQVKKNLLILLFGLVVIVVYFVYSSEISQLYQLALDTNEYYVNRTEEMSSSAMLSLPHPFREIAMFCVNNFFGAAANWRDYVAVDGLYTFLMTTLRAFYGAFWLIVFLLSFKWLFYDRKFKMLKGLLKLLFFAALFIELVNSSQLETRRVMCVYPVFYLIFIQLKNEIISKKQYKRDIFAGGIYYLTISLLYTLIK